MEPRSVNGECRACCYALAPAMPLALRYITVSAFCFSVMGAFIKDLRVELSAEFIIFYRSAVCVAWCLWGMPWTRAAMLGSRPGLLLARGLLGFVALQAYVVALGRVPYPDAAALLYTSPVFTFLFAAWFLGERLTKQTVTALALCLGGAAFILRPQFDGEALGGLLALTAGVLAGAAYVCVRALARTEPDHTILLAFPLISLPCAGLLMLDDFVWPHGWQWAGLLAVGVSSQLGQIFLTRALRVGRAGPVTTGYFLSLLLAGLWAWLFFDEVPSVWVGAGAACILAGVWLVGQRRAT